MKQDKKRGNEEGSGKRKERAQKSEVGVTNFVNSIHAVKAYTLPRGWPRTHSGLSGKCRRRDAGLILSLFHLRRNEFSLPRHL